jgi:cytidylate kinase
MSQVPVIAIDGPSGSGKGTIARRVASQLGWHLLDSGALYRLVAMRGQHTGLALDDIEGHTRVAATLDVRFGMDAAGAEQVELAALMSPANCGPRRRARRPPGSPPGSRSVRP